MSFRFLFAEPGDTSKKQLYQGDLLLKNAPLTAAIAEAHSYYADADDYTHLMVLTQSCDLARHGNHPPKSRYITLAAARPASIVVKRYIDKYKDRKIKFPIPVCRTNQEKLVANAIERLLHNTHDGFFFIPKNSHPAVNENLCVFLPLSISLRVTHYDTCLNSKVAQLSDVFQAKVGWLTGNQYSKVGTPDIEEQVANANEIKNGFYDDLLYSQSAWLSSPQISRLKKIINAWQADNEKKTLDINSAQTLLEKVPDTVDLIAERIANVLVSEEIIPDNTELKQQIINLLRNDDMLKQAIRAGNK